MLRLLAASHGDGWAYVRSLDGVYLVRPPYTKANRARVDDRTIQKAVATYGFCADERPFPDWKALISYLNQKVAESRRLDDEEVAQRSLGEEYLQVAPPEDLHHFLDRLERELLPDRKLDQAERVLLGMLRIPDIRGNQELVARALDLLETVARERREAGESRRRLLEEGNHIDSVSPRADRRYGRERLTAYCRQIADQGHIFSFVK